jgi:serine/threonine protein kinase
MFMNPLKSPDLNPRLPDDIFCVAQPRILESRHVRERAVTQASRSAPKHERGLFRPGSILDKYRIEELVGTGGFGAVYRARHLLLDTSVAIKHVLPDIVARRPELVTHLIQEARWAARIQHPNVVRVLDATQNRHLTYIVMELIEGPTLARAIRSRGRFDRDEVVRMGIEVAEGLKAGLANGLVHRDVKPSNIVLCNDGRAKIVDLGLARAAKLSGASSSTDARVVGTRGYIAPEQFVDPARADFRADIFSLGVTLAEALWGKRPTTYPAVDPTSISRSSHRLAMVLRRMTAERPADRMGSYDEVVDALRRARSSAGRER